MYGLILGDMVGSPYEFKKRNIFTKEFELFSDASSFTDDTVMAAAIADALLSDRDEKDKAKWLEAVRSSMKRLGAEFPLAGFGMTMSLWLNSDEDAPCETDECSAASRVAPVAFLVQDDFMRMRALAVASAQVTHSGDEAAKGADAVASAVFLALHKRSKEDIKSFVEKTFGYDLSKTCADYRDERHYSESCGGTVPQAVRAFLEGEDFEDVIRTAVSMGGDSGPVAAMAGSMAEAFYGVPDELKKECREKLPEGILTILDRFYGQLEADKKARQSDKKLEEKWQGVFAPKPANVFATPQVTGNRVIEEAIDRLHREHSKDNLAMALDSVRVRMDSGAKLLIPVKADKSTREADKKTPGTRHFELSAIRTKDGKLWQPAYTTGEALRGNRVPSGSILAFGMRQFLLQYTKNAPKGNRAPDRISGIVINAGARPLFLSRQAIEEIFRVDEKARGRIRILIAKGDISKIRADAAVREVYGDLPAGQVHLISGEGTAARYIIETQGPVYGLGDDSAQILSSCYTNSLEIAKERGWHSIVFPCISTGTYGYPKEEAAKIAIRTVLNWLGKNTKAGIQAVFCCADDENYAVYRALTQHGSKKRTDGGEG